MVKNKDGKTAEDILRTEQPDGWEENLHWLQKFLPGKLAACCGLLWPTCLVRLVAASWSCNGMEIGI